MAKVSRDSQLKAFRREKDMLEATGFREARKIARTALVNAIDAYKNGFSAVDALTSALDSVEPLIIETMVHSEIMGISRGLRAYASRLAVKKKAFGPYDWARAFVADRLKLTDNQLDAIRAKYGNVASNVTSQMSNHAERVAKKAVAEIVSEGMHVKQGTIHLRKALHNAGVQPNSPWLLETLVRTQIHVAYGVGRWQAMKDPDVDEILWGYEYVAIDDDRVRPAHKALDGSKLPKDDPRWSEIWPPNGYNCRCEVIEIFDEGQISEPPEEYEYNGNIYIPGADKGWNVNHGEIFTGIQIAA